MLIYRYIVQNLVIFANSAAILAVAKSKSAGSERVKGWAQVEFGPDLGKFLRAILPPPQ